MRAVLLAGGLGKRLGPYTTVLPKPLMPVGDKPILELLIRRLRRHDIRAITIAVGHLAPLIMAYFGDGRRFDVSIDYAHEDAPVGTAGPLANVSGLDSTFLVMNGDLLTDVDFGAMVAWHDQHKALATIGVYARTLKIDLGVIHTDDAGNITDYIEKPLHPYTVSMGVYVLEPAVLAHIKPGKRLDLPELVHKMLAARQKTIAYVHRGYWLDIGRLDDYERAQQDAPWLVPKLLGETAPGGPEGK